MDRFNKLPFPQKAAILVVVLGLIAGLFYYTMITPLDEAIQQTAGKERTLQGELTKLQTEAAAVKPDELVKKKQSLEAERLGYEELLPKTEELVKFISGLSETAKTAGLDLMSFEKGKPSSRNFYTQIPIAMSVRGTYRELIGFLRSVAAADRRVVNIRDLKLSAPVPDTGPHMARYTKQRADALPKGYALRALTESQLLLDKLHAYEDIVSQGIDVDATFTAFVFLYTGKELTDAQKAQVKGEQDLRTLKMKEHRLVPL